MNKTSKNTIFKVTCSHALGLCSSVINIVTKRKLPLSAISYSYPQLVTLFVKKDKYNQLETLVVNGFKNISYPFSQISYSYPQLVTLFPKLVTLLSQISYLLSQISYPSGLKSITTKPKKCYPLKLLKALIKLVIKREAFL